MLYFAVGELGLEGGVCVTASHNPKEYTGMKIVRRGALPVGGESGLLDVRDRALKPFGPPAKRGETHRNETPATELSRHDSHPPQANDGSRRHTDGMPAPEPTIECVEGDKVRIFVTNKLPEHTTVHWHGILLPNGMDGVGGLTQPHIPVGKTYVYEFQMKHSGTFMYHPHADEMVQMAMGMMGSLVVHPRDPNFNRVDRDFAFMLAAYDIEPGAATPKVAEMTDFNLWTFNTRVFPGIDPLVVYGTLFVKCPVGDATLADPGCQARVLEEIAIVQPKLIVVMGDEAMYALQDLQDFESALGRRAVSAPERPGRTALIKEVGQAGDQRAVGDPGVAADRQGFGRCGEHAHRAAVPAQRCRSSRAASSRLLLAAFCFPTKSSPGSLRQPPVTCRRRLCWFDRGTASREARR